MKSYDKPTWKILEEIHKLAVTELNENKSIGYTMPDGKHHLFISVDDNCGKDEYCYIIEPNLAEDGAHTPIEDNTSVSYNDFGSLLIGCMWCIENFFSEEK